MPTPSDPVFARPYSEEIVPGNLSTVRYARDSQKGIDLRTYLAAHAPPKPAGYSCHPFSSDTMQHAEWAVRYADALIERLNQPPL